MITVFKRHTQDTLCFDYFELYYDYSVIGRRTSQHTKKIFIVCSDWGQNDELV